MDTEQQQISYSDIKIWYAKIVMEREERYLPSIQYSTKPV